VELSLHDIHSDSIELALDKAKQYRSLLEPEIAESICLDILHIEPEQQQALVLYILALTDQLDHPGKKTPIQAIETAIEKLKTEYQRHYYRGLLNERRARFMLTQTMTRGFAYAYFIEALTCYHKAEQIRPEHNDESILRWNSCIRTLENEKLKPREDNDEASIYMES
jgi:phage-related protein